MSVPFFQCHLALDPVAKERPRVNRRSGTLYTPQKTRDYEKLISQLVAEAATEAINETDDLWIECSFELAGNKRKDLDNLVKAVWDGITLSKAVWGDDKQVVSSRETVEYGADLPWVSIAVGVVRAGAPRGNVRSRPQPKVIPNRVYPTGYAGCSCGRAMPVTAEKCRHCG